MKKLIPLLLLLVVFSVGCDLTGLTVTTSSQAPVISSFDADSSTIAAGESSTLSWSVVGATMVSIDQGIGNVALSGRRAVMPSATTVYTLTATNVAGVSTTATAQVIVSGAPSPSVALPVVNSFTASPSSITVGSLATLSWNVSNATSVAIDPGVGTFASSGTTIVSPLATTVYTLMATNAAGSTTEMTQITVSGAPSPSDGLPVVSYFTANPPIISAGSSTTLSWSVSNATSVDIQPGVGSVGLVGTAVVSPAANTDYTLTAINGGWVYYMTITVLVTGAPPPAGEPDLIIEDISRSGDKISYKIKNQGGVAAGASISTLFVDGAVAANDSVGSLAPGESKTETFTGYAYSCTLPADTVEVRADTGVAVTEGSEANNSYTESWSCLVIIPGPLLILKPDLVIEDIWKVSEITGDKIYYRIKNKGDADVGATTTALFKYPCLYPCSPVATDSVLPLAAGASREEKFASYNFTGGGALCGVGVEADRNTDVLEKNESNNSLSKDCSDL